MRILLVEDNDDHAELVKLSLDQHRVANEIFHVEDGQKAVDYLFRRGAFQDPAVSPRPTVILLDLRLPKIDGLEVLREIKAAENLKNIPVVVLTTSAAETDVSEAYAQHVNSFVVKPLDFQKFSQLIEDLGYYWMAWNRASSD